MNSTTRRVAILELGPAALHALLQLPAHATVVAVDVDFNKQSTLRLKVEGIGYYMGEGAVIPVTKGVIETTPHHTVTWPVPTGGES